MDFISSIFNPIVQLLEFILGIFHDFLSTVGLESYGVAIIVLTIIIKMAFYPLTVKQVKSMKAMQELQPKMKKLQDKFKNDPKRLQQEMGMLYKNAGVNPLAGCLPLLAQMPILMAMFYALQSIDYGGDPAFLWIMNLSNPDPYYILPVLSAISTYVVQKQTSSASSSPQMQMQMKIMSVVMPLFIGWISCNFAAGLVIYWIVNNIMQILQQWWMYRHEDTSAKKGS